MIFNIRPATQKNAPQIKDVLQDCFEFFDESMITQIKHGCLVAETDNKIVSVGGIMNSPYIKEKKYLVCWKKDGVNHNAVFYGKNKRDIRTQLSWENITASMIRSIEELKEENNMI